MYLWARKQDHKSKYAFSSKKEKWRMTSCAWVFLGAGRIIVVLTWTFDKGQQQEGTEKRHMD